jgi:hypothetical protein
MGSFGKRDGFGIGGVLRPRIWVPVDQEKHVRLSGLAEVHRRTDRDGRVVISGERRNAFVNLGLGILLDRLFGIGGPPGAVSHMGVSADAQAAGAGTSKLDPAGDATGFTSVGLTNVSRAGQTVSCEGVFSQATVAFAIKKVGLLNKADDDGTGLINVIGGTGGSAPYNEPFTIDLTGATTWDLTLGLDVTATAT